MDTYVNNFGYHLKTKMGTHSTKINGKLLCVTLLVFFVVFLFYNLTASDEYEDVLAKKQHILGPAFFSPKSVPLWDQKLDFETLNFNNETGNPSGCYVVPNYIHFIHFGGKPISYVQLICILAALKNQNPEKIFFHYDNVTTFTGKYWNVLEDLQRFTRILVLNQVEYPDQIFGQPLSYNWRKWHAGDIMRLKTLIKYGGVCIDADCYIAKSLDDYRRFEMTLNWDEGQFLGSQTMIAHKDARFLKKHLDSYRYYDKEKWYYNAGERPTVEILYKQPELIHRVKVLFGADTGFGGKVFNEKWQEWRDMYVIHLLARHQYNYKSLNEKAVFPVEFNESNIAYYDVAFREMAYDVYDTAGIKWAKDRFNTEADWPKS